MPTQMNTPTGHSRSGLPCPRASGAATCATLQLWMQIVGKIRLALMPPINHCWGVTLYPTVRGVTTSPMPYGNRTLQIDFDFVDHVLVVEASGGGRKTIPLKPMTVATFYRQVMDAFESLGTPVRIWPMPVEVADPIRFEKDEVHKDYDPEYVAALLAHSAGNHARLHDLSRAFQRQGEPRPPFLGSARPGVHALFRPHRARARQHAGAARSRNPRCLFARSLQLRILARRPGPEAASSRSSTATPIPSRRAIGSIPIAPAAGRLRQELWRIHSAL